MPYRDAPTGPRFNGWYHDQLNNVLEWYQNGTKVAQASGATVTDSGSVTATALAATTGDVEARAGNVKVNSPGVFGTTQPVGAVVIMVGTAPAGTITTGVALFTDGTTMKKIIAANTVSDVQT